MFYLEIYYACNKFKPEQWIVCLTTMLKRIFFRWNYVNIWWSVLYLILKLHNWNADKMNYWSTDSKSAMALVMQPTTVNLFKISLLRLNERWNLNYRSIAWKLHSIIRLEWVNRQHEFRLLISYNIEIILGMCLFIHI